MGAFIYLPLKKKLYFNFFKLKSFNTEVQRAQLLILNTY